MMRQAAMASGRAVIPAGMVMIARAMAIRVILTGSAGGAGGASSRWMRAMAAGRRISGCLPGQGGRRRQGECSQGDGGQPGHGEDVDGLSFAAEPGQVTGFLGPNGAGKPATAL
jgi:hypothetical protein